jgi:hypothetical protein
VTIADIAATVAQARIASPNPKLVTLDIERVPGRARVEHRGLTIEGDFWDLSGWKHVTGRRIHADDVLEWPRTVLACWKWYDSKKVESAAEWDDGGADAMHQRLWDVCDRAAIVVGHNAQGFDLPKLRSGWWLMGLPEPSPYKIVDTLKAARSALGEESNTLDALCKRAGLIAKTDKYNVEVARAACAGDKTQQRNITAYCRGDVRATESFLDSLRGRIPNHPHIGEIHAEERRCNQCGSADLARNGLTRAVVIDYVLYRCGNCGANVKGVRHSRSAETRGAR